MKIVVLLPTKFQRFLHTFSRCPILVPQGTDTATKVTIKDGNYLNSIIAIQTAALVVLIVGSVAFYIYILRPFMLGMQKERAFLSQLMSEIPKTFDIESHCVELFNNVSHQGLKKAFYEEALFCRK